MGGSTTSFGSPTRGSMYYGTSTNINIWCPVIFYFGGSQSTTPTFGTTGFGQSDFCSQHGRSRVAAYTATAEVDEGSTAACDGVHFCHDH
ncbi:unnamed protein product [Camellia sinensis]